MPADGEGGGESPNRDRNWFRLRVCKQSRKIMRSIFAQVVELEPETLASYAKVSPSP